MVKGKGKGRAADGPADSDSEDELSGIHAGANSLVSGTMKVEKLRQHLKDFDPDASEKYEQERTANREATMNAIVSDLQSLGPLSSKKSGRSTPPPSPSEVRVARPMDSAKARSDLEANTGTRVFKPTKQLTQTVLSPKAEAHFNTLRNALSKDPDTTTEAPRRTGRSRSPHRRNQGANPDGRRSLSRKSNDTGSGRTSPSTMQPFQPPPSDANPSNTAPSAPARPLSPRSMRAARLRMLKKGPGNGN